MKSVIIVEDARGIRELLVELIDSAPDIKCLGAFASGEDALPVILKIKPDVVLMDVGLPRMSGIQCMAEIKRNLLDIQIIMVTTYEDSESIFRAFKSGANGFLIKSDAPEKLINAIRDACQGGAPMSGAVARKMVQHFQRIGPLVGQSENISQQEREVISLLAMGFSYKEIEAKLNINAETIHTNVKNICQKFQVRGHLETVGKHQVLTQGTILPKGGTKELLWQHAGSLTKFEYRTLRPAMRKTVTYFRKVGLRPANTL